MKNQFSLWLLTISSFAYTPFSWSVAKNTVTQLMQKLHFDIPMRVLLDEKDVSDKSLWTLEASQGFLVVPPKGKKIFYNIPKLSLATTGQGLAINGKQLAYNHVFIIPVNACVSYKTGAYGGVLSFTYLDKMAYLVNHIDLEDYVASIVPSESWPGWPDEVNKAFCIGFRTYGVAKIFEHRLRAAKQGKMLPYDVKNTRVHQVFKGCTSNEKFKKLAEETRGIVLAHKNQPILAMFDICCGGVIPARKRGIDFEKAPYLARPYACNYCRDYKFYRWQTTYTIGDFEARLKSELPRLKGIRDIKVSRKDGAGIVQEISIRSPKGWFTLSGSKFKSLLKELKSLCFTVQKKGSHVVIQGKGFGHLVGLCQRGAYALVGRGWTYKKILQFYYPHTHFMKVKKLARRT